jgi:hypothetical protein
MMPGARALAGSNAMRAGFLPPALPCLPGPATARPAWPGLAKPYRDKGTVILAA